MSKVVAIRPKINSPGIITTHNVKCAKNGKPVVDYAHAAHHSMVDQVICLYDVTVHVVLTKAKAITAGGQKTPCASMVGLLASSNVFNLDAVVEVSNGAWKYARYDPRVSPDSFEWQDGHGHWNEFQGCHMAMMKGKRMIVLSPVTVEDTHARIRDTIKTTEP